MRKNKQPRKKLSSRWAALEMLAGIVLAMWAVFALQSLLGFDFTKYGILPRQKQGLLGIIVAPFIHSSVEHIGYNTLALVFVSLILALSYPKKFIWGFWALMLTTDILVWLFARSAYHIGCSGVVFALIGFTFAYGIARRSVLSIILSIIVGAIYGGILYGILPLDKNISWESHLFGLLSGIAWGIVWGSIDFNKAKEQKLSATASVSTPAPMADLGAESDEQSDTDDNAEN